MSTIVTRAGKGSALTHAEVDANFVNLNNDKLQSGNTAAALTITTATINGGAINATTIGASTATTGAFTVLTASSDSSFTSTGALQISKGTTGEQPGSPATGMIRYNTTTEPKIDRREEGAGC